MYQGWWTTVVALLEAIPIRPVCKRSVLTVRLCVRVWMIMFFDMMIMFFDMM